MVPGERNLGDSKDKQEIEALALGIHELHSRMCLNEYGNKCFSMQVARTQKLNQSALISKRAGTTNDSVKE
jgi:hypothetical protein